MAAKSKPPAKLGTAGAALWRRLTTAPSSDLVIEFSPAELVLLELACKTQDTIAALEATLAADGLVATGSAGQLRVSGVVSEIRLQRAALAKLVAVLDPEDEDEKQKQNPQPSVRPSQASRKASAAARARWEGHERRERSKHADGGA